jgi:hypothetical protein
MPADDTATIAGDAQPKTGRATGGRRPWMLIDGRLVGADGKRTFLRKSCDGRDRTGARAGVHARRFPEMAGVLEQNQLAIALLANINEIRENPRPGIINGLLTSKTDARHHDSGRRPATA